MKLSRLRSGEWLTAVSVAVMLVALFALAWYRKQTGWDGVTHLRWLLLIAILLGAALVITQAAFRAPAIPVSLDVISTVVAIPTVLWLIVRVVIDAGAHQKAGPWLELLGAIGLLVGSFLALRQEGIRDADGPGDVPLVDLGGPRAPDPGPA
ncbi:MAG TPA: hypothetical protein VKT31_09670 [Solirubrobacteraceae bacterium]|nr:hypothetical protein [Solirubrobacteraceae bacterium]